MTNQFQLRMVCNSSFHGFFSQFSDFHFIKVTLPLILLVLPAVISSKALLQLYYHEMEQRELTIIHFRSKDALCLCSAENASHNALNFICSETKEFKQYSNKDNSLIF